MLEYIVPMYNLVKVILEKHRGRLNFVFLLNLGMCNVHTDM